MVEMRGKAVWKFAAVGRGEQCVMTSGMPEMLVLYALSLDTPGQVCYMTDFSRVCSYVNNFVSQEPLPMDKPPLDKELVPSTLMM